MRFDLTLKFKLTQHAVEWCWKLLTKAEKDHELTTSFSHSKIESESVYVKQSKDKDYDEITGTMAVTSWYCNGVHQKFAISKGLELENQFSHMIWNETQRMGIAKLVEDLSGNVVIVAKFFPEDSAGYVTFFKNHGYDPVR